MKNVAIIMGGYSSEADISLKSGQMVYASLDKSKFMPIQVHISQEQWVGIVGDKTYPIHKEDFSLATDTQIIRFDCVFNAIHGTPGEDGQILAYLELLGIPHTSAPFYQMALTFNKRDTLSVVKAYGVQTAISVYCNKGEDYDIDAVVHKVGLPCFVKPNGGGSSFGISKVYEKDKMQEAIEKAFEEDDHILIESFLDGVEVSVGVIEYKGEVLVLPMTEIVSENDFFDYEAKYLGKSQEITPARISNIEKNSLAQVAKKVYKALNMKGFSRAEYILVEGIPYFLEINTVPGLTKESILPQQAAAAGISLEELFTNAIEAALR